jgi:uncharacterized membrane protein YgcG
MDSTRIRRWIQPVLPKRYQHHQVFDRDCLRPNIQSHIPFINIQFLTTNLSVLFEFFPLYRSDDVPGSEIYVAFCNRRPNNDPLHWILLVATPGSRTCTWYYVEGNPTQGYTLKIQANKRMDSFGIASKQYICRIDDKDIAKLRAAAQSVPMQRCQKWTVEVLRNLERRGLVPSGTTDRFAAQVEQPREVRPSGGGSSHSNSRSGGGSGASAGRSSAGSRSGGSVASSGRGSSSSGRRG